MTTVPSAALGHAPPPEGLAAGQGVRFGRGALSRQLILRVTALVAIIAIVLSALTALAMHRILINQLDHQLVSTAARVDAQGMGRPVPGAGGAGQAQGLLIFVSGWTGFVQVGREREELSDELIEQLEEFPPADRPSTVTLTDLGGYRIWVTEAGDHTLVIGLPTTELTQAMLSLLTSAGLLTLLAVIAAALGARAVVEQSLRPLARLASTASQVASLELDSGEVNVPVRVADSDTDPSSEVGQVGLAFNRMLDNVEDALDARQRSETKVRQFVADASHELRNPLASIRGYAELTRRGHYTLPPDAQHALSRIESESNRMSVLVEDLLLLARLDSRPDLTLHPTDLAGLVVNAVSDAQAASADHQWTVSLPEAPVSAVVDANRIHQVVANLLANARAHTPAGTRVDTSLAVEAGQAVIRVSDNGPGIPDSIRDTLFERFTRADTARVRSGRGTPSSGLGLAIVYAVVSAHGGTVAVSTPPGGGTTFTVRLPLKGPTTGAARTP